MLSVFPSPFFPYVKLFPKTFSRDRRGPQVIDLGTSSLAAPPTAVVPIAAPNGSPTTTTARGNFHSTPTHGPTTLSFPASGNAAAAAAAASTAATPGKEDSRLGFIGSPLPPSAAAAGLAVGTTGGSQPRDSPHRSGKRAVRVAPRQRLQRIVIWVRTLIQAVFCCLSGAVQGGSGGAGSRRKRAKTLIAMPRIVRPLDRHVAEGFDDNTVVNSRYTLYNFLFKNLWEQFTRPLNFYFLMVATLQFFSIIAPVNPMSTLLPLLFAFSLTAVKEGYDDVKRHRQDNAYNQTLRSVLDVKLGQWRSRPNASIRVGDVMLLHRNEEIPCDAVVVAASSSPVFIRTDNLDGEIDLKPRDIVAPQLWGTAGSPSAAAAGSPSEFKTNVPRVAELGSDAERITQTSPAPASSASAGPSVIPFITMDDTVPDLMEKLAVLELNCPPPTAQVECFDGRAEFRLEDYAAAAAVPGSPLHGATRQSGTVQVSLSHLHLLPQSCLLKNTEAAIAVAVYTGNDTKIGMNKRPAPTKWAKIDKDVSRYSIFIFCCQMISACAFGVSGYLYNRHVDQRFWYLPQPAAEAAASTIIYPLRFFLLTTVMIPVSFKFVVDMSKYYMAMTVEWDLAMMHESSPGTGSGSGAVGGDGTGYGGCKVKNSSILEDLGQIDYVLSDKTGTMTQNVMELQYVSVGSKFQLCLGAIDSPGDVSFSPTVRKGRGPPSSAASAGAAGPNSAGVQTGASAAGDTNTASTTPAAASAAAVAAEAAMAQDPSFIEAASHNEEVIHFATLLSLCNTVEVVPAPPGSETGVSYQAASPDETALCVGASKLHVSLVSRDIHRAVVEVHGVPEEWIIHHVFQFTSEKKSMGVIVEHVATRRILFVVKGADDRVIRMMGDSTSTTSAAGSPQANGRREGSMFGAPDDVSSAPKLEPTFVGHLATYARSGLRTLLVASKELTRDELRSFLQATRNAELAMERRHEELDLLRTQLECRMSVIGITAIEDKLQVDVRETVSDLLQAGIKVWMLTGDKVETAEQIGLSCSLYSPQDRVIRVVEDPTGQVDWVETLMTVELPPLLGADADLATSRNSLIDSVRAASRGGGGGGETSLTRTPPGLLVAMGKRVIKRVLFFTGDPTQDAQDEQTMRGDRPMPPGTTGGAAYGAVDSTGVESDVGDAAGIGSDRAVLIVQGGHVLDRILRTESLSKRFGELSRRCISVICARTTPSQKAAVTDFVRSRGFMTLSIGDGGNDVAMLQEAHVGVGIFGKEGQQAARAADFAIAQFSDLRPLIFLHGQCAYVRTAYVIKYSFYKSMLISFIQLAYNVVGTYVSGGTFWNSFSLTMWNGVYTLPQTLFYCLDRCAPRVVLERTPALYKLTRRSADMSVREFFVTYMLRGMAQSVMLLWVTTKLYGTSFAYPNSGGTASNDVTFSVAYTALMISQFFTVLTESHSVTSWNWVGLLGMPVFYVFSTLAFSGVPSLQYFGVFKQSLRAESWLAAFGAAAFLVLPFHLLIVWRDARRPNSRDTLRAAEVSRQRRLLRRPEYKRVQPWLVRWFGFTPEAPSVYRGGVAGPAEDVTVV